MMSEENPNRRIEMEPVDVSSLEWVAEDLCDELVKKFEPKLREAIIRIIKETTDQKPFVMVGSGKPMRITVDLPLTGGDGDPSWSFALEDIIRGGIHMEVDRESFEMLRDEFRSLADRIDKVVLGKDESNDRTANEPS